MRRAALFVLVAGSALCACNASLQNRTSQNRKQAQAISICSLIGRDAPPSGIEVRVRTFYTTDYMEHAGLADPECPSFGVAVSFQSATIGTHNKKARERLIKMIQADEIEGHLTGVYEIDFTGRFVYRKDKQPHGAIDVDHVWSFKRLRCTTFYSGAECNGMD